MNDETTIWEAKFTPSVCNYWLLSGVIGCVASIVGIVLIPFWILLGIPVTRRFLASHRCTLTDRNLKVAKGILVRQEKTVPLDRITDMGLIQGPIMRLFDIEALSVETAGQSAGGALVSLSGIERGREFRDAVLKQRDLAVAKVEGESQSNASASSTDQLLTEIRDSLLRLEQRGS